ncbi:MAG: molecular chaperone TorD family protein [Rhodospirillales bacterium]|nr:molecular chaperone TorD family protein [Rhodospirillales bacterium]
MGRSEEDALLGQNLPKGSEAVNERGVSDVDMQRAHLYGLLARLLGAPMSDKTLDSVRALESDYADADSDLGKALVSLGAMAGRTVRAVAEEEYTKLFYGMGAGGEVQPYASFYLTGFVYEKPLANLRRDMAALGIAVSGTSDEPEDHAAYLSEIMHGLITGAFGEVADLADQKKFHETHMAPWVGQFFADLEGAESAALYMPVGTIGRLFLAIEADAFDMAAYEAPR